MALNFFINGDFNRKYVSEFYKSPNGLALKIQAPQNFFKGSSFDNYPVALNDEIFIKDASGEKFYSKKIANIEDYVYPDLMSTYRVTMVEELNGVQRSYAYTLPNKNVLLSYEVLETYKDVKLWVDETINISTSQIVTVGYSLNAGTYEKITATGNIAVVENKLPNKKYTTLGVCERAFDLLVPLRYGEKPQFRLSGTIYDDYSGRLIGYYTSGKVIHLSTKNESAINTALNILNEKYQ